MKPPDWRRHIRAYGPSRASSAACVPVSTMRPRSSTTSRSMRAMVDSRCAMAITVRPSISAVELALDGGLDLGIEGRGRLVQHQDRRVLQDHPGQRDPLTLPARKFYPALADMRVVAVPAVPVLQLQDKIVRLGAAGGVLDHRLGRLGPTVADIVANGPMQQRGVLRHHGDLGAQAFLGHAGDILAVDEDAPA